MKNRNIERWNSKESFNLFKNNKKILSEILTQTSFKVEKEISRAIVYESNRIRNIVYKGIYNGNVAVLKINGLKIDADESDLIRAFEKQNKSNIIRAPKIYLDKKWDSKKGYSFIIFEFIEGGRVYDVPFASKKQIKDFGKFYQEYRTKAITKQFLKKNSSNLFSLSMKQVDFWEKLCKEKGRIKRKEYLPYLLRYKRLAKEHLLNTKSVLSHSGLNSANLHRDNRGNYVLMSNLLWGYMFEWADLSMPIWGCLLNIRDIKYSHEKALEYVQLWINEFQKIPVVKKDKEFNRKFALYMLNRALGTILADLGAGDYFGLKENRKYLIHLLGLEQQIFDHFASELERE